MKKVIIFAVSICMVFITNGFADDNSQVTGCGAPDDINMCGMGCEYVPFSKSCQLCLEGTYNSKDLASECIGCSIPAGGKPLMGDEYMGFIEDSCPWTASCTKDQYWQPKIPNQTSWGCTECGKGYTSLLKDDYVVNGAGTKEVQEDLEGHSFDEVCDGRVYQLNLLTNDNGFDDPTLLEGVREGKSLYYKYDNYFSVDDAPEEWSTGALPDGFLQPSSILKTFLGYGLSEADCSNGYLAFDSEGKFSFYGKDNILTYVDEIAGIISLQACWFNNSITINYNYGDAAYNTSAKCGFVNNDDVFVDCKVNNKKISIDGLVFEGYECTYIKDGNTVNCYEDGKLLTYDEQIPILAQEMSLTAIFSDCPAGYYCGESGITKCPIGTTSNPGSTSIEKCFMKAGTDGTRFCDNNGCFFLPGSFTIPYMSNNQ